MIKMEYAGGKMLASIGPGEGNLVVVAPNRGGSLLAYTTESHNTDDDTIQIR